MQLVALIEKAASNIFASAPDLPNRVATGATVDEARAEIAAAICSHIDGLIEDGFSSHTADDRHRSQCLGAKAIPSSVILGL